jgi:hypothetical protein
MEESVGCRNIKQKRLSEDFGLNFGLNLKIKRGLQEVKGTFYNNPVAERTMRFVRAAWIASPHSGKVKAVRALITYPKAKWRWNSGLSSTDQRHSRNWNSEVLINGLLGYVARFSVK